MFSGKRTKYQYFNNFTSVVINFQYDASYIIISNLKFPLQDFLFPIPISIFYFLFSIFLFPFSRFPNSYSYFHFLLQANLELFKLFRIYKFLNPLQPTAGKFQSTPQTQAQFCVQFANKLLDLLVFLVKFSAV